VDDVEVEQIEAIADNEQKLDALARAIQQLNAEERALVTLFYYEERSVSECAEIVGQSQNNIKVRLHRIRKKLYILIQDETK
jgi:RNA polymerase sigma-70 factor (ECF subfamily)